MAEENVSQEFRLKNLDETRNYFNISSQYLRKKKKDRKIVLLAKSKSNSIEVFVSKFLIVSVISHGELVLINNVLKEYDKMKEEI